MADHPSTPSAEWVREIQHRLTFAGLALLMLLAAYGVCRLLYSHRIETLNERIKLRDDTLAEFEGKVGTSSPDDVAAKIADLVERVTAAKIAPPRAMF